MLKTLKTMNVQSIKVMLIVLRILIKKEISPVTLSPNLEIIIVTLKDYINYKILPKINFQLLSFINLTILNANN